MSMPKDAKVSPFSVCFQPSSGLSDDFSSTKRCLSSMRGMYADSARLEEMIAHEDMLVYEFYELDIPQTDNDLAFGTSIVYPGKVGNEYFMTKGHFHMLLETAEIYHCLSGKGCLLMENPEGDFDIQHMQPGTAVYVPGRYAHRSINTGEEPLVMFFAFRADAGHDYKTIESKGFRKLVVEVDGQLKVVDNPKWIK